MQNLILRIFPKYRFDLKSVRVNMKGVSWHRIEFDIDRRDGGWRGGHVKKYGIEESVISSFRTEKWYIKGDTRVGTAFFPPPPSVYTLLSPWGEPKPVWVCLQSVPPYPGAENRKPSPPHPVHPSPKPELSSQGQPRPIYTFLYNSFTNVRKVTKIIYFMPVSLCL